MARSAAAGAVLLLGLLGRPAPLRAQGAGDTLLVIVNDSVPENDLSRADARRIFLLRRRFWKDGRRIAPVNLPADSPIRERFSRRVLGQSPRSLAAYWNDLYFHGVEPPPVLESERAVVLYVARTRGAIGYVEARVLRRAEERAGVRVLLRLPP